MIKNKKENKRRCIREEINISFWICFVLGAILLWLIYQYNITSSLAEEYRYKYSVTSQLISCEAHERIIEQQQTTIENLQSKLAELSEKE